MVAKSIQANADIVSLSYRADSEISDELRSGHSHDRYEISLVLKGRGKYIVEGQEYELSERTVAFIPPLSYHCYFLDEGDFERYVVHFSGGAILSDVKAAFAAIDGEAKFYPPSVVSDAMISVFMRLEGANALSSQEEREAYMKLLLGELIFLISVARADSSVNDEGELGARVIRYLNENITADISLDRLAKRFFVSKYYLCRAFKRHNGISIHSYVTQKRVLYAKQLIEDGETASGAAYRVGFGDYSAFYRAYMKIVGASPAGAQTRRGRS